MALALRNLLAEAFWQAWNSRGIRKALTETGLLIVATALGALIESALWGQFDPTTVLIVRGVMTWLLHSINQKRIELKAAQ